MGKVRVLAQVSQLQIGEDDVLRGFVDVEHASQVEVRSNARCRIAFHPSAAWFNFVHVYGFPRVVDFGPEGGGYLRPLERQRSSIYQLSYRFELRPDTLPGIYRWPLAVCLEGGWEDVAAPRATAKRSMPPAMPG